MMIQAPAVGGRESAVGGRESAVGGRESASGWTDIRSSRGRLLCRLDVGRLLLEVKPKGEVVELVDLRPLLGSLWAGVCGQWPVEECKDLIDQGTGDVVE